MDKRDPYENKDIYLALLNALQECYESAFEWSSDRDPEKTLEILRGQYDEALRLDWDLDDSESLKKAAKKAVRCTGLEYVGLSCIKIVIEKFEAGAPDSWDCK